MTAAEAARRWADVWARGWRAHDVDAIVDLYAEDARFRSAPFRDPHLGRAGVRAYVEWAFASEEPGGNVRFGEPLVAGSDRAVVEYWATLREGGKDVTIAGIAVLRFGTDGRVVEQRDYWSMEDRRRDAPAGWGR